MNGIYLLLGGNMGDRQRMLMQASAMIGQQIGRVIRSSSIYETRAWGVEEQPDFLNQVLEVGTALKPAAVLAAANEIEAAMGRVRKQKWHERVIDIDILYFGDMIINTETLVVPHPENQNRNFVLVPMAELAPDFMHPILGLSQQTLLAQCPDRLVVTKFYNP